MMHKTRLEIEYPWRNILKFVSGKYVRAPGYTAAEMMRGGFPALSIWTPPTTIECGVGGTCKWMGIAECNGLLYCAPFNSTAVLQVPTF